MTYFLFRHKKYEYSLEVPRRGASNEYLQDVFIQKYEKYQNLGKQT